jgi:hypothetical protein
MTADQVLAAIERLTHYEPVTSYGGSATMEPDRFGSYLREDDVIDAIRALFASEGA